MPTEKPKPAPLSLLWVTNGVSESLVIAGDPRQLHAGPVLPLIGEALSQHDAMGRLRKRVFNAKRP